MLPSLGTRQKEPIQFVIPKMSIVNKNFSKMSILSRSLCVCVGLCAWERERERERDALRKNEGISSSFLGMCFLLRELSRSRAQSTIWRQNMTTFDLELLLWKIIIKFNLNTLKNKNGLIQFYKDWLIWFKTNLVSIYCNIATVKIRHLNFVEDIKSD